MKKRMMKLRVVQETWLRFVEVCPSQSSGDPHFIRGSVGEGEELEVGIEVSKLRL